MSLLFKNLFRKETNEELEERLSDEIIRENEQELENIRNQELPVSIISYSVSNNEDEIPEINILVEEFHCNLLPEPGSIIWITGNDGAMRPHKTIRFDFIENGSEIDTVRVYIVVEPAFKTDVVPHPKFLNS